MKYYCDYILLLLCTCITQYYTVLNKKKNNFSRTIHLHTLRASTLHSTLVGEHVYIVLINKYNAWVQNISVFKNLRNEPK